jgi:diguanylate cyclase (GGDEF)-like protein
MLRHVTTRSRARPGSARVAIPAEELPDTNDRLVRRLDAIRGVLALAWLVLALFAVVPLLEGPVTLAELVSVGAVLTLGVTLLAHHRVVLALTQRRSARESSMTRIVQGLSRSLSPESVAQAIMEELGAASAADHIAVARVRQTDQVVEVTLVAASPAVPQSQTVLRQEVGGLSTETPPGGVQIDGGIISSTGSGRTARLASQAAADEIARRVRSAYGLPYTLAEPLVAERRFLGALILSKRTRESWSDADRRLLAWSAQEVAAAFARAYVLEEAERDANIDALTNLPNRRYFDELLSIMQPRRRANDSLGVLMIDIDHFKRINDRYGHVTGDGVLRAIAGAIATTVRAEDTPARYGGEEFAVILRRASASQATEVAERVRQAVSEVPPDRIGTTEPVTVSVGVAVAVPGEEVADVVDRADRALLLAKRQGRDQVVVG